MDDKPATQFGPMAMIQIDGGKIKRLREEQGLTQLYIATAIGVTTDTISRWENGRYPSIKRDNGCRLAETLGVQLEEILQQEGQSPSCTTTETTGQPEPPSNATPALRSPANQLKNRGKRQLWPLLLLTVLTVTFLLFQAGTHFFTRSPENISAVRTAPSFALVGQAVPIIIDVEKPDDTPVTLILTEQLARGAKAEKITPSPSRLPDENNREIKWLGKIERKARYSFLLYPEEAAAIPLTGTISFHDKSGNAITGQQQIQTGSFHWADANQDNRIDDREIILVYDRYGDIPGFSEELDKIEDIWLGSGYRWEKKSSTLTLLAPRTDKTPAHHHQDSMQAAQ